MTPDEARALRWRPGQRCQVSGQYAAYDASATRLRSRQATMLVGHRFPPIVGHVGATWRLTDPTLHVGA